MLACYSAAILACLAIRPLWVDELLRLMSTRRASIRTMLGGICLSVGAVPLGYLTQRPFVLAAGPSAFWARFPSAIFTVASCCLLIWICHRLRFAPGSTAVAIAMFMIAPAQLRYAMEGRPYSEALFFGLLAAVALAKLAREPKIATACLAIAAITAALHTQAYVIFAVCGVALWYAVAALRRGERRQALLLAAWLAISTLLFAPWYLAFSQEWHVRMRLSGYPNFHWTPALALDIVKSISGGSLLCSTALLVLAAAGLRGGPPTARLLSSVVLIAIAGPVAEDSLQNYFFAARQILFALPALAILAAIGFTSILRGNRFAALALLSVFGAAALISDASFQINRKEDWRTAAKAVAEVSSHGYCILPAVDLSGAVELYSVFIPSLASTACGPLEAQTKVALVSNFTMDSAHSAATLEKLQNLGFVSTRTVAAGGTTIHVEERQGHP